MTPRLQLFRYRNNYLRPLSYVPTQDDFTLALEPGLFQGQARECTVIMAVALSTLTRCSRSFCVAQRALIEGIRLSGLGRR